METMREYRRHFHKYPELAFKEHKTGEYILKKLGELSCFKVKAFVGGTGLVASYTKVKGEKYIGFRADMDALPIHEETNLPFASEHKNISHACGHDLHMAILLKFAEYINENKEKIQYNIKLLFQPAEELDEGANAMIKEGVLKDIEEIYGFHVINSIPLGTIMAPTGVIMGATEELNIKIIGKSGHGAEPFKACDPITKASQVILFSIEDRDCLKTQMMIRMKTWNLSIIRIRVLCNLIIICFRKTSNTC